VFPPLGLSCILHDIRAINDFKFFIIHAPKKIQLECHVIDALKSLEVEANAEITKD